MNEADLNMLMFQLVRLTRKCDRLGSAENLPNVTPGLLSVCDQLKGAVTRMLEGCLAPET